MENAHLEKIPKKKFSFWCFGLEHSRGNLKKTPQTPHFPTISTLFLTNFGFLVKMTQPIHPSPAWVSCGLQKNSCKGGELIGLTA